jgi:hypothetical protein
MVSLSDFFLNIATLGLSSVRDGMYQDIAKVTYERTGAALLASLTGVILGIAISLITLVAIVSVPQLTERLKEWRIYSNKGTSSFRSFIYCWIGFMILASGFLTISYVRVLYTVNAASYIDQLQRIVSPKLTADQRIEFQSRAAQISKKADFVAITDELRRTAEANKFYTPTFDIF